MLIYLGCLRNTKDYLRNKVYVEKYLSCILLRRIPLTFLVSFSTQSRPRDNCSQLRDLREQFIANESSQMNHRMIWIGSKIVSRIVCLLLVSNHKLREWFNQLIFWWLGFIFRRLTGCLFTRLSRRTQQLPRQTRRPATDVVTWPCRRSAKLGGPTSVHWLITTRSSRHTKPQDR